jgi:hypothetical protein
MLHIRVVTTPGLTGRLLDRLADLPGIRNLIVLEGAARPSGDAIFFDVDHSAANPVFRELRGLSLDHDGAVTVEQVDASLARTTGAASAIGSPASEKAPVWEMVEAAIRGGAVYSPSFFGLLAIAALIGALGILTNSQILVLRGGRDPGRDRGHGIPDGGPRRRPHRGVHFRDHHSRGRRHRPVRRLRQLE